AVSLLPVAHGLLRRGMSADVPDSVLRGNEAMQRGFLQAVFTAGGDVESDRQAPGRIRLAAPLPLLQGVQRLLLNFGIYSRIAPNPHTGASLHEGVRRSDGFPCRARHYLTVSGASARRFHGEIGFLCRDKQDRLKTALEAAGAEAEE